MKILIAEDNSTSRILLSSMVKSWGYQVSEAEDGVQTLAILEKPQAPQLILLDWMMPGTNGPDICRHIRRRVNQDPAYVIMITAREGKENIITGLEAGANDYITKPYDRDELRARISVGQRVLELQTALAHKVRELQCAFEDIQTLRGIIPICMHCHKIRNDREAWQKIEAYISEHSKAQFSHSICPECLGKYYPDQPTNEHV
jgi:DNA-binding response OmpR family regulator